MEVTAYKYGYKNKANSIGYGFRVSAKNSNLYFKSEWKTILLELPDNFELIKCGINKGTFWYSACNNLMNKKIGEWLIKNGFTNWSKGNPPKFNMIQVEENKFKIL